MPPTLLHTGPLPPARNGIADYAARLLPHLAPHYRLLATAEDWQAETPPGVPLLDPALVHRHLPADARILHQLGDNAGHVFSLPLIRRFPGVTLLHDPGLLHLHQLAGAPIAAGLRSGIPGLAAATARLIQRGAPVTAADHSLFDLAGAILAHSRAVILHTEAGLARLRAAHGAAATAHCSVIPHPIPDGPLPTRAEARARLGIGAPEFIVLTAGFPNRAKRFDWMLAAADALPGLRWIHAGEGLPRVPATGYLPPEALLDHVAAADVLVNLRFPARGEASGTLALALAAGTCAIVTATSGYREIPPGSVIALPPEAGAAALTATLAALRANPDQARAIGEAGRAHAVANLTLAAAAARIRETLEASHDRPTPAHRDAAAPNPGVPRSAAATPAAIAAALAGATFPCQLRIDVPDHASLAALTLDIPGWPAPWLPPGVSLRHLRPTPGGVLLDLA